MNPKQNNYCKVKVASFTFLEIKKLSNVQLVDYGARSLFVSRECLSFWHFLY